VRDRAQIAFGRHSPAPAKDWNDVLQRVERDFIRSLPPPSRTRFGPDRGR
jgi:hypothetical protein